MFCYVPVAFPFWLMIIIYLNVFCYVPLLFRVTKPEETVFHLLHLSLMREYLDFEFGSLKVRVRRLYSDVESNQSIVYSAT